MTHFLSWLPACGLGHAMALGLRPLPRPRAKPGLRPRPWPWPWASGHCLGLRPSLGFGQGTSQIAKRLMAISLEPWPKILDIRGCAWGKPAGSRQRSNPPLRGANSFYSHKNRAVTKPSSKCLPHRGKASGLDSEWLRRLSATLFVAF